MARTESRGGVDSFLKEIGAKAKAKKKMKKEKKTKIKKDGKDGSAAVGKKPKRRRDNGEDMGAAAAAAADLVAPSTVSSQQQQQQPRRGIFSEKGEEEGKCGGFGDGRTSQHRSKQNRKHGGDAAGGGPRRRGGRHREEAARSSSDGEGDSKGGPRSTEMGEESAARVAAGGPLLSPTSSRGKTEINFPIEHVLAPMVGASELAFRLLCRKYGAQLAYTPMMDSHKFVGNLEYRSTEFQTCRHDRPLVCHFSSNCPEDFAKAAAIAAPHCDAIDLNLGCPQRVAYAGHFGSYLLDECDRKLVCDMVRAASQACSVPIFCKIRLLDSVDDTVRLCEQLRDAGASLIAIHARYRATWKRDGPGARDGPALLDQVRTVKDAVGESVMILANGNVINYQDVAKNLHDTRADGVMSAEGLLDDPALFLPRYGGSPSHEQRQQPTVTVPRTAAPGASSVAVGEKKRAAEEEDHRRWKKKRRLTKKLKQIEGLEGKRPELLSAEERAEVAGKSKVESKLEKLEREMAAAEKKRKLEEDGGGGSAPSGGAVRKVAGNDDITVFESSEEAVPLRELIRSAEDKVALAREYLALVRMYPVTLRSVIFHTRRILKDELNKYQLMQDCVSCRTVDDVSEIVDRIRSYRDDPNKFVYDREKAERQRQELQRKKEQEGCRRRFEERMIRKAKREGREDRLHYLKIGAEVPTEDEVEALKKMPREDALVEWKRRHSQHCLAHHLDSRGCQRGRTCAFLHVDVHRFDERDEVAG